MCCSIEGQYFPIFIKQNNIMKKWRDIKQFKLYLWVGLAYMLIGLLSTLAKHPGTFFPSLLNSIWAVTYVMVLNYTLFEYTLPLLSRKRIFKSLIRIVAYFLLYSIGAYMWKYIGIGV